MLNSLVPICVKCYVKKLLFRRKIKRPFTVNPDFSRINEQLQGLFCTVRTPKFAMKVGVLGGKSSRGFKTDQMAMVSLSYKTHSCQTIIYLFLL